MEIETKTETNKAIERERESRIGKKVSKTKAKNRRKQ